MDAVAKLRIELRLRAWRWINSGVSIREVEHRLRELGASRTDAQIAVKLGKRTLRHDVGAMLDVIGLRKLDDLDGDRDGNR